MSPNSLLFKHCNGVIVYQALQTATWILAICMSEYSGIKIFNFPNLVCFFKESSAGQIKGLSGPDVVRGPYFGDPCIRPKQNPQVSSV